MVRRMFYQKESNLAQPRSQGTQVSFLALPLTSYVALGKPCNLESLLTPQKIRMIIGIRRQFINALINRRWDVGDGAVVIHPGSQTTPVLSAPLQGLPSPVRPQEQGRGRAPARREGNSASAT